MKKKQAKSGKRKYSFDEFLRHFRDQPTVRRYQHVNRSLSGGLDQVEIGDDRSFELNVLRVMDYFGQVYTDRTEAREKGVLFVVMMTHLAKYRDSYDSEKFAVFADNDQASLISVPLLHAVHHYFTSCSLQELPQEETLVEPIKQMARVLSENWKG